MMVLRRGLHCSVEFAGSGAQFSAVGNCIERMKAQAPRAILERKTESFTLCCSLGARRLLRMTYL
jgi:hypothetical protein